MGECKPGEWKPRKSRRFLVESNGTKSICVVKRKIIIKKRCEGSIIDSVQGTPRNKLGKAKAMHDVEKDEFIDLICVIKNKQKCMLKKGARWRWASQRMRS